MSTIYGPSGAKAGLITYMPEGKAEDPLDAKTTDVIPQGKVVYRDIGNATPAERKWKMATAGAPPTAGTVPVGISTKEKIAGEKEIVGVWNGDYEVTVEADDACEPDGNVTFSTINDGNVMFAAPGTPSIGRYIRRYAYANDADGNRHKVANAPGDIIVIKLWG